MTIQEQKHKIEVKTSNIIKPKPTVKKTQGCNTCSRRARIGKK